MSKRRGKVVQERERERFNNLSLDYMSSCDEDFTIHGRSNGLHTGMFWIRIYESVFLVLTTFLHELDDMVKTNAASDAKQKHKTPEKPPKWTISKDWVKGTLYTISYGKVTY